MELLFHAHGWSGGAAIDVNGIRFDVVDLFNQEIAIVRRISIDNPTGLPLAIRITPAERNPASQGGQLLVEGIVEYSNEMVAPAYTRPESSNRGGAFRPRFYEILDSLDKQAVVLDLGGGKRKLRDQRYINLDYSSLEEPQIYGDGCALPFKNASIDFVYTAAVLEHVRDPLRMGKEIHRVLKPGGYVLANSAFMQPVHSEGQHFFNLTPYGIDLVFEDFPDRKVWWETAFAYTMKWFLQLSQVRNVSPEDIAEFHRIADLIDADITDERGMYFASGVWLEARKPLA
ncbi:MAG: methyltransferase domain-containing protein [Sphingobium sp.]